MACCELPHHARVFRGTEVQAVGDRQRNGSGGDDVAVGLGERELRAGVRVEHGVAAVAVGGHREAALGPVDIAGFAEVLGDPDDAGVGRLGEHGVAADVPVVLVGHPARASTGSGEATIRQDELAQLARPRPRQRRGGVGLQGILRSRAGRTAAGTPGPRARPSAAGRRRRPRPGTRRRAGPVSVTSPMTRPATSHFAQTAEERVDLVGRDDRAHPLLRLAGQDLGRRSCPRRAAARRPARRASRRRRRRRVPMWRRTIRRRRGPGCRPPARRANDLERALDQHLLGERVADLHGRQLRRPAEDLLAGSDPSDCPSSSPAKVSDASTETPPMPSSPVREPYRMILLPTPDACAVCRSSAAQHADAGRVDQRVAGVGRRRT